MGVWLKRLSILSLIGFPLAVLGVRLGVFDFRIGISMTGLSLLLALVVAVISIITIFALRNKNPDGAKAAKMAVVISLFPILGIGTQVINARSIPEIHNISTDVNDPPVFDEIVNIRSSDDNPLVYNKDELAEVQLKAYPKVKTLISEINVEDSFDRALVVAKELNWEIVSQNSESGIIEATETTRLWGFKDDIVIRVRASTNAGLTSVDLRSVSRVGRSDLGANAKRITAFLDAY